MADLNVNSIGDASGGNTATINSFTPTESNMAGRNRIINGDMRIDQRNAGASVTPASGTTYLVDRFNLTASQSSKFACQQNAGSVTPPTGFTNYLGFTSQSSYSSSSTDYFLTEQVVEGFNVADLGWGTANAQAITISFWVRSSLTGTHSGALRNGDFTRSYPFSFTVSSANTWEQKTLTVAGDTSGTWLTNNSYGIRLDFDLGTGTTYRGTANAWSAGSYVGVTGAVSVVGTSGATFYITGVQLEAGSVATPFEHRLYGQELQLCKRYYQRYTGGSGNYGYIGLTIGVGSGTNFSVMFPFEQEMRAAPSRSYDLTGLGCWDGVSLRAITSVGTHYINTKGARVDMSVGGGGLVVGNCYSCYGSTSTIIQLNAEL